jgi:predicted CxxxxCH...CXXCH cytochrome family protein
VNNDAPATVSASGYSTYHVNKTRDVAIEPYTAGSVPGGGSFDPATKQCSNVYCHSNAKVGTAVEQYAIVTWGGAALDCTSCHDYPPSYTNGGAGTATANSHPTHVNSGIGCQKCHNQTTQDGTTIRLDILPTKHVNANTQDVYFDSTNPSGIYNTASKTCSTITCHNDGTAVWTGGTAAGDTPAWGTDAGCGACHGNTMYTDYRKAAPLYTSGSPKPNAHQYHVDTRATPSGETQCLHCHYATTTTNTTITDPANHKNDVYDVVAGSTYPDGDNITGGAVTVTINYTFNGSPSDDTCSNVSCHPTGLAGTKTASVTVWSDNYNCTDCHNIDLTNTTGYHHAMNNTQSGYPTTVPQGDATTGTNATSRKCTMCHVDHSIFSPRLNASNTTGRSMLLRTDIATVPTATSGYANSDYVTGGGICISCHQNSLTKDTSRRASDGTTATVVVTDTDYAGSAHQYTVTSTLHDGSTFNANCSKCHNARNNETTTFQTSANKFALHDSTVRRLFAFLGITTPTDPLEENFCFRCHSQSTDTNPGGGPAKATGGMDYYGVATMSGESEAIYSIFDTKAYTHPVTSISGIHKPGDGSSYNDGSLTGTNRHAECEDCHNPHAATASNPLKGASGVSIANPTTNFTELTSTNYTYVSDASVTVTQPDGTTTINLDYKVCMKCHSNWAYGVSTNAPNPTPSATWQQTNMAQEFNVNNWSYHYVEGDLLASVAPDPGTTGCDSFGPSGLANTTPRASTTYGSFNSTYIGQMEPTLAGLTDAERRQAKLRCSSCHGVDNASGTTPEGPHGSSYAFILKVPSGSPYTRWDSTVSERDGNVWCFNCHDPNFSSTGFMEGTRNLHTRDHNKRPCQYCHVAIPHGWKRYRFLKFVDCDPAPYNATGNTGLKSGINWKTSGNWQENDCHDAAVAGCG